LLLEPSGHADGVLSVPGLQEGLPCPLAWRSLLEAARPLSGLEYVSAALVATEVAACYNSRQRIGASGAFCVPLRELTRLGYNCKQ
jgi:hypothetical protein